MDGSDDAAFGEAAIERGLVTRAQLDQFVKLAATVTRAGLQRSVADILLEKGVLTEFQVELIRRSLASEGEKRVVGGFEILKKIGEGGMGTVYKARQVSMDRVVALKLLPEKLAKDEIYTARFLREARMAAKLDHANIVRGIDVGKDGDDYYFAMEFVEGESVGEVVKREGAIPEKRTLRIIIQVARALEHAWKSKLIHRDIKPDNILLAEGDVAKLADMGLAKQTTPGSTVMTQTGVAMGTPLYMSPEQARGEKGIDARTDIYSLGATSYHMLTGEAPFSGSTAAVVITKHLTEAPVPAHERNPQVSERTSRIIGRMMQKKPEARYADPTELLRDLELAAQGKEPEATAVSEAPAQTLVESAGEIAAVHAEIALRRPSPRKWIVPAAAAGVLVVAGAVAALALAGGDGALGKARTEYRAIMELVEEGQLEMALGRAEGAAVTYAETDSGPQFRDQATMIRTQLGQTKKLAAEKERLEEERKRQEEERKRREQELARRKAAENRLAAARALVAETKFGEARTTLTASTESIRAAGLESEMTALLKEIAGAEKAEAERERLAAEARARDGKFAGLVAQADEAAEKADHEGAVRLYDEALALKDDPAVRAKRDDAQRKANEDRRLTELLKIVEATDPRTAPLDALEGAKKAAEEAMKLSGEEEAARLRRLVEEYAEAIDYRRALDEAERSASRRDWKAAKETAHLALLKRPGDEAARVVLARAEKALKREKRPRVMANGIGIELVRVPAGEFTMGSESGEADERPAHAVRLSAFWIGRTEATNAQYELFDPAHQRSMCSDGDDSPVVKVSWNDAVRFCEWLSGREGARYRLPTEAEWERAARGTDRRAYPWGNDPPDAGGVYRANLGAGKDVEKGARDGYRYAAPVGSFPGGRSPCGCLDMAGNVWEWCADWYVPYPTGPSTNPRGPGGGTERVLRGGSWYNPASSAHSTNRGSKAPETATVAIGFRVVREVER